MNALIFVVATFHSLGLTWAPSGGGSDVECEVRYRAGEGEWQEGLPLWFDARAGEYRGSLVELAPGTTYTIELTLENGTTQTTTFATWSEDFPVARTVDVSDASSLVITEGGSPDGYVVYEGGTIDASADDEGSAVTVRASYVILRNMTIIGGRHAIKLEGAHDVVIEESDVSGWGHIEADGWGDNEDAAVKCSNDTSVERIIVQRNHLHHPRSDSNSWEEYRADWGTSHPIGPQAVQFSTCGGNHVFRYNDIYSDDDHRFQDAIGGGENFSDHGFPFRDTDIYGNRISHCWDDAIEAEGANENVRIWGNYLDRTYVMIAAATTSVGPLYVFRNIANETQRGDGLDPDSSDHGPFMKLGGHDQEYAAGRIYVFHNTTLQPRDASAQYGLGVGGGLTDSGADIVEQVVSRNNVFYIHKDWWSAISDGRASDTNDFDYDLYNGNIDAYAGAEPNGIHAVPIFDGLALDPSSPGYDRGIALPGFNDRWQGAAPDLGAQEHGGRALEFGADAYRDQPMVPPVDDPEDPMTPPDGGPSEPPMDDPSDGGRTLVGCGCSASPVSRGGALFLAALLLVYPGKWRRWWGNIRCGIGGRCTRGGRT